MKMKWYWLALTIIFIVLGILTLVPAPVSKPNLIGYHSICPFAPVSTIISWAIAGVFYWLGRRK